MLPKETAIYQKGRPEQLNENDEQAYGQLFITDGEEYRDVCRAWTRYIMPLSVNVMGRLRSMQQAYTPAKGILDALQAAVQELDTPEFRSGRTARPDVIKSLLKPVESMVDMVAQVRHHVCQAERECEEAKCDLALSLDLIDRKKREGAPGTAPRKCARSNVKGGRKTVNQSTSGRRRLRRRNGAGALATEGRGGGATAAAGGARRGGGQARGSAASAGGARVNSNAAERKVKRSERIRRQTQDSSGVRNTTSDSNGEANDDDDEEEDPSDVYCMCREASYGKMIQCENGTCVYKWFHFPCVRLTASPRGVWYCPFCRDGRSNRLASNPGPSSADQAAK